MQEGEAEPENCKSPKTMKTQYWAMRSVMLPQLKRRQTSSFHADIGILKAQPLMSGC